MVRLGKRFDIDWLVYNPIEFYRWHLYAQQSQRAFVDSVLAVLPDVWSVADIGAGTGTYGAEFRRRGKHVVACETNPIGRAFSFAQRVPSRPFDLTKSDPTRLPITDLAYCLEVAEHAPPEQGDRLVEFLSRYPTVLFTAAHPGQGGLGHINEQPKNYWVERFGRYGKQLDEQTTAQLVEAFRANDAPWWFVDNAIVLRG